LRIPLLFTAGILVAAGCGYSFSPSGKEHGLRLSGVVETQELRLGSKIGGRVERVHVVEGAVVDENQPLVTFETPELDAQVLQWQARLRQAEADRDKACHGPRPEEKEAARLAVEVARQRWNRLQAGPREQDIYQARCDLESAEVNLHLARQKSERLDRLHKRDAGAVGLEELETAQADAQRCQSLVNKARSYLAILLEGTRAEEKAEAKSLVDQSQANYALLLSGTRDEDKAAAEANVAVLRGKLEELKANRAEAVVRAPDRAIVEILAVRKGDLVAPNQPIVRALRSGDTWVRVYVPETQLGRVRLGQQAEVTSDSYPGRSFQGTVMQIGAQSEFTPRNVQSPDERRHEVFSVKIRVVDPEGVFKSGMSAEVLLPLDE
jgi:multidrug resistance efflux pump